MSSHIVIACVLLMVARLCVMVENAEMYWLMVARLCMMARNAETKRCFSCQNHRDVLVDGGPPVRDGEECRD